MAWQTPDGEWDRKEIEVDAIVGFMLIAASIAATVYKGM